MGNIRESLYQSLSSEVTFGTGENTVELFSIGTNKKFSVRVHAFIGDLYVAVLFSNGTIKNSSGSIVPSYKIEKCEIYETIDESESDTEQDDTEQNKPEFIFARITETDNAYHYLLKINNVSNTNLVIRKEIIYGEFESLTTIIKSVSITDDKIIVTCDKNIYFTYISDYSVGTAITKNVAELVIDEDDDSYSFDNDDAIVLAGDLTSYVDLSFASKGLVNNLSFQADSVSASSSSTDTRIITQASLQKSLATLDLKAASKKEVATAVNTSDDLVTSGAVKIYADDINRALNSKIDTLTSGLTFAYDATSKTLTITDTRTQPS